MKSKISADALDVYNIDDFEEEKEAILAFFADAGFAVTEEALIHNYEAWRDDYKSGYLDKRNGYFLFTPCGCNPLMFRAERLNGRDYQETYEA